MNALNKVLWRMQYEKSRRIPLEKIQPFSDPAQLAAFLRFNQYLTDKTNTRLEPLYQLRLLEIDRLLRKYDVHSVYEMGSGRTTFFFNLFRNIDTVSYEQDEQWRELQLKYSDENGLPRPQIVESATESYRNGGRFVALQGSRCDLLYIDGPYISRTRSKFDTHTGKPAYFDFERFLDAGLPKIIMVEGRTDTVDAILASPHAREYDFNGELTWALERHRYAHALRLSRHSIFLRKS